MKARLLARAALYAALYAALTLAPGLNGIAYGQVQFRLSEGLLTFATLDAAAVPGLAVGTALANLGSPLGVLDVVAGGLLTLVAATLMWYAGPHLWALAVPVAVNGFGVAAELALVLRLPYWPSAVFVALGEAAVMASAGLLLLLLGRRHQLVLGLAPRRAWDGGRGRTQRRGVG